MGSANSGKVGQQLLLLLVLLGALGGLGAWNYHRNVQAEAQEKRPYRTLSDADLATLTAAYESEVEQLSARYTRSQRKGAPAGAGGDEWGHFEAVQRHSRATREVGRHLAEQEASLEELRREQKRRDVDELEVFLKRLLTFSG